MHCLMYVIVYLTWFTGLVVMQTGGGWNDESQHDREERDECMPLKPITAMRNNVCSQRDRWLCFYYVVWSEVRWYLRLGSSLAP